MNKKTRILLISFTVLSLLFVFLSTNIAHAIQTDNGLGTNQEFTASIWPPLVLPVFKSHLPVISADDVGSDRVKISWHISSDPSCNKKYVCKAGNDWGGSKKGCGSETLSFDCGKNYTFSLSCRVGLSVIREWLIKKFGDAFEPTSVYLTQPIWQSDSASVRLGCVAGVESPGPSPAPAPAPGGGGGSSNYCATIDRGSGACAHACYTSVSKCDKCKAEHGCGGGGGDEEEEEEEEDVEVDIKAPEPSTKLRSEPWPRVEAGVEVRYKVEVDNAKKNKKIHYSFQCNRNQTGVYDKRETKKSTQYFDCKYTNIKADETWRWENPWVKVRQEGRGYDYDDDKIRLIRPSLSVSLSAKPSSVTTDQSPTLTANVSGSAQGTIHYQFDCTNNGNYEVNVKNNQDPYSTSACRYSSPGTYTARVLVERGWALDAKNTVRVTVVAPISPLSPPSPPPSQSQCNDIIDNDGDSKIDFPSDPGCSSSIDDDEFDAVPPPPPSQSQCNDIIDNDGDSKIDYPADPGCTSLSDENEFDPFIEETIPQ